MFKTETEKKNEKLLLLKSKLKELKLEELKLTQLIDSINFSQNLDWVMDLTVEKGKKNVDDDFYYDEESEHISTYKTVDCLKITNVVYDKHNLLPTILEFLMLQKEIYQEVPDSINEDSVLLVMIKFIVEQFLKLCQAHLSEKDFHNYIREVLNKVPQGWEKIEFEEKYQPIKITFKNVYYLPGEFTEKPNKIFYLVKKINELLPNNFKLN